MRGRALSTAVFADGGGDVLQPPADGVGDEFPALFVDPNQVGAALVRVLFAFVGTTGHVFVDLVRAVAYLPIVHAGPCHAPEGSGRLTDLRSHDGDPAGRP